MRAAFDFANKDHVIAFKVTATVEALKTGSRPSQQGGATSAVLKCNIGKSVNALGGKPFRKRLLIGCQNIDRVM